VNGSRWQAVPAQAASGFVRVLRRLTGDFLAIAGIVAFVLGLLYRFADWEVPHLLQARSGDSARGTAFLLAGAACLVAGRLIRPRRDRKLARWWRQACRRREPGSGLGAGAGGGAGAGSVPVDLPVRA
jgi:hypothetical protein